MKTLKYIMIVFIFPLVLCADINKEYSELFSKKLKVLDIIDCKNVLDDWERNVPLMHITIEGLRACLVLVEGNIWKSYSMMEDVLTELEGNHFSTEIADSIRDLYMKAWNFFSSEKSLISFTHEYAQILLCKNNQPKGVKVKYWFGVAQLVAACLVAPFNPPTAAALALSGLNTTAQAVGEALDNKDEWERNLTNRQRINPENIH